MHLMHCVHSMLAMQYFHAFSSRCMMCFFRWCHRFLRCSDALDCISVLSGSCIQDGLRGFIQDEMQLIDVDCIAENMIGLIYDEADVGWGDCDVILSKFCCGGCWSWCWKYVGINLVDCAIDVHVHCDIDGVGVLIVNDVVILDVDPDDGADDTIKHYCWLSWWWCSRWWWSCQCQCCCRYWGWRWLCQLCWWCRCRITNSDRWWCQWCSWWKWWWWRRCWWWQAVDVDVPTCWSCCCYCYCS